MVSYTFMTEQAKSRTITTLEEAQSVIIATAMVRSLGYDELRENADIVEVAQTFDINLNDLVITPSTGPNDFAFTYSFK